jgi:hypothetical protein
MNPRERIKHLGQLIALGTVVVWGLLCFLIVLHPRLKRLDQVNQELTRSSNELTQMRKEIEDARISGGPAEDGARFGKFGILAVGEEDLFLDDLISFCRETNNDLRLVRRSEHARRAPATTEPAAQQSGSQSASGTEQPPQPVIDRVPHTVSFSGTFASAFHLLRRLELYKRLLTVERVQLSADTLRGYPRINGNITIDLYVVEAPALPTADQAAASASTPAGPTS